MSHEIVVQIKICEIYLINTFQNHVVYLKCSENNN